MNDFLTALKEAGIKGDPQILLNGIRFWNPLNRSEIKIYFDDKMISYIAGCEQGVFPYSLNSEEWPDQFIELVNTATRVI